MNQGQEQLTNAKILIVDDTAISRKLLAEVLRREKYAIYEAVDGTSGLEIARLISPALILLDICMPGVDGHTVCRHLKQQPETRNIPVVFVTASTQYSDRVKALGCGGMDYITKPFVIPELKRRVAYYLQGCNVPLAGESVVASPSSRPLMGASSRENWFISRGISAPYPSPVGL